MGGNNLLIIGYGNAGLIRGQRLFPETRKGYIDCSPFVRDVSILDIDPDKVRAKLPYSYIPVYTWEEIKKIVDKNGIFDAAFICTPIASHKEVFEKLVSLGLSKRVLIEKPLGISLDHAKEISRLALEHNIETFCGYHVPNWNPAVKLKKRLEETGVEVDTVICSYTKNRIGALKDHLIPEGGVLDEEGPHIISLMKMVMGENPIGVHVIHRKFSPIQVSAANRCQKAEGEFFKNLTGKIVFETMVVGEIIFSLYYRNEKVAIVDSSFDSADQDRGIRVRAKFPLNSQDTGYKDSLFTADVGFVETSDKKPFYIERSGEGLRGQFTRVNERETEIAMTLGDVIGLETYRFLRREDNFLCSLQEALEHQAVLEALQCSLLSIKKGLKGVMMPGQFVWVPTTST